MKWKGPKKKIKIKLLFATGPKQIIKILVVLNKNPSYF